MDGFDENVGATGEWVPSWNKVKLISLNEVNNTTQNSNNENLVQGCLTERIAARAGFTAPMLNTDIIRTDSSLWSPDLSPTTFLESPVFISNPLAQLSPTTGKCEFLSGVSCNALSSDEMKDEFFDGIEASFTFQPVSGSSSSFFQDIPEILSVDDGNYNNIYSHESAEDVQSGSQNEESSNLYGIETDPSGQNTTSDAITNTDLETIDHQEEEEEEQRRSDLVVGGAPAEDGYNWRKYGQKLVKGSEYPRSYYKCTNLDCQVKKNVERSKEGHITEIIYKGHHNHPKTLPSLREQSEQQKQQQRDSDAEWGSCSQSQQQFGSNDDHFGSIQAQTGGDTVDASLTFTKDEDEDDRVRGEGDELESKRRKVEVNAAEISGATRSTREPRIVVETQSEVDILNDGYRWRKYGQKVVKGNPNPRSYYKCTASGCSVRKHVERASHDLKSVITTYEGKHNHEVPAARNRSHEGDSGGSQINIGPPRGRFERPVMMTDQSPFEYPSTSGFPFGLGQTSLSNVSMPGLEFGEGEMPVMPYPYLSQATIEGMMEARIIPVSETKQSVYNKIMSKLPRFGSLL